MIAGAQDSGLVVLDGNASGVNGCDDVVIPIDTLSSLENDGVMIVNGVGLVVDIFVEELTLNTVRGVGVPVRGTIRGVKRRKSEKTVALEGEANAAPEPREGGTGLDADVLGKTPHVTVGGSPSGLLGNCSVVACRCGEILRGAAPKGAGSAVSTYVIAAWCCGAGHTGVGSVGPCKHSITFLSACCVEDGAFRHWPFPD